MEVHLVDGTYELFRHYFAVPEHTNRDGREVAAARGVLTSMVSLLEEGATHVGVATDHVVESFQEAPVHPSSIEPEARPGHGWMGPLTAGSRL